MIDPTKQKILEFLKKHKKAVFVVIGIVLLIAMFLVIIHEKRDKGDTYSSTKNSDEGCPFYAPDGNAWRDCVRDDLDTIDKEIVNEIVLIKEKLTETIKRLEARDEAFSFYEIPAMLDDYHKKWLDYRNIKCEIADQDVAWGSAIEGFINGCKTDESYKYLDELKMLDKKWNVDYEINLDKAFD